MFQMKDRICHLRPFNLQDTLCYITTTNTTPIGSHLVDINQFCYPSEHEKNQPNRPTDLLLG